MDVGDYSIDTSQVLGRGSFGKIFKCHKKNNPNDVYCAKFIDKNKSGQDANQMKKILDGEKRAFEELKKLKNENLVSVYDIYEFENHLIIIMELCDCDLEKEFNIIKSSKTWLTQYEQINMMKYQTIKYILVKIVNMDFGQKKIFKISDFGFCRRLDNFYKLDNLTRVGTLSHCAPEIIFTDKFNAKCDIYSYGILFYQICNFGQTPFQLLDRDVLKFLKKIQNKPFKFSNPLPQPEGQLIMNLIEQMIFYEQDKRLNYNEIFHHEIFTKSFPVRQESLFTLKQDEIIQNGEIKIIFESYGKQQNRLERIYHIQEIFYRKYLLCLSVEKFLEQIILPSINCLIIRQIICQIGYQQINFALAACYSFWCEIHHVFRNGSNNDMLKLMKIFKNYQKKDQRYQEQQLKIKKAFVEIKTLCSQKLDKLLENIIQEKQDKLLTDPFIQKIQVQKVEITELCDELTQRISCLELRGWFSKLPEIQKQNIQKICDIEKNQFEMLNYQLIDLDEIIKI